ncbi:MAG: glycosyltransferase family 4 protein [bacterium]
MKVCFCSPGIYHFFREDDPVMHGGAELQQYFIAQWLRNNGIPSAFITGDFGQPFIEEKEGFQIVKMAKGMRGGLLTETFLREIAGIEKAMRTVDADIYYQRGAGTLTGKVAYLCRRMRKPFVFGVSSDADCDIHISPYKRPGWYERRVFLKGLRQADLIIAQTEFQRGLLKNNFGNDSIVITNCYPVERKERKKESPPKVLWVGEIYRPLKRAEVFLQLAAALPDVNFIMVAGPEDPKPELYAEIRSRAERMSNVEFLGFVPCKKINHHFERASILVDTSAVSGFHNTFLQAWANENPVVSLEVDPDDIICRHGLGFHAKNFENLVYYTKKLVNDAEFREKMGQQAYEFVSKHLDVNIIGPKYREIFKTVYKNPASLA